MNIPVVNQSFPMCQYSVKNQENTQIVIDNIISILSEPFIIDGQPSSFSASIGVALFPQDAEEAHEVLQKADQAMYAAKNAPEEKKRYHYYQDFL